ncbi:hypothetical protein SRHO_G00211930 [Serrasalmus rhombeus]
MMMLAANFPLFARAGSASARSSECPSRAWSKTETKTLSNSVSQKAKQIFQERIFTLEDATDEAPESVLTAVCEILRDHSVDLLDRAGRKLGPKL